MLYRRIADQVHKTEGHGLSTGVGKFYTYTEVSSSFTVMNDTHLKRLTYFTLIQIQLMKQQDDVIESSQQWICQRE